VFQPFASRTPQSPAAAAGVRFREGLPAVVLNVSSRLDALPDAVWKIVKSSATFQFVTRGILSLSDELRLPPEWAAGQSFRFRLILFGFIPAWMHEITILSVDDARRTMQTAEKSGPLRRWDHTLSVRPSPNGGCSYTDTVNLDAGLLTPLAWAIAHVFFRYRQFRFRRLARSELVKAAGG
jgi:hypothetical protein